jgi:hypothetical protein
MLSDFPLTRVWVHKLARYDGERTRINEKVAASMMGMAIVPTAKMRRSVSGGRRSWLPMPLNLEMPRAAYVVGVKYLQTGSPTYGHNDAGPLLFDEAEARVPVLECRFWPSGKSFFVPLGGWVLCEGKYAGLRPVSPQQRSWDETPKKTGDDARKVLREDASKQKRGPNGGFIKGGKTDG